MDPFIFLFDSFASILTATFPVSDWVFNLFAAEIYPVYEEVIKRRVKSTGETSIKWKKTKNFDVGI